MINLTKNKHNIWFKLITLAVIISFLCQNAAVAGGNYLATNSLFKLIERHHERGDNEGNQTTLSQKKLKTELLSDFLKDPDTRVSVFGERARLPKIPDKIKEYLDGFFEEIEVLNLYENIFTVQVKLDGKVSMLYLFKNGITRNEIEDTLNIHGTDLDTAFNRGYWFEVIEPEWVKVRKWDVRYGSINKDGGEVAFIGDNLSKMDSEYSLVQRIKYKGKVFVAKTTVDTSTEAKDYEDRFITPQARIMRYLEKRNIPDINEAEHYLELEDGRKVILFKDFYTDHERKIPEGENVKDKIDKGDNIPEQKAVEIALKTAKIVKALHKTGVRHCDIKPANIWLTEDGRVTLFDFGFTFLSKNAFHERGIYKCVSKPFVSPNRMGPLLGERSEQEATYLPSDDVFSVVMTLAHILVGKGVINRMYGDCVGEPVDVWHNRNQHFIRNLKQGPYGLSQWLTDMFIEVLNEDNLSNISIDNLIDMLEAGLASSKGRRLPNEVQRAVLESEPEWIGGVKTKMIGKPKGEQQIKFSWLHEGGKFVEVRRAEYDGQTYYAKMAKKALGMYDTDGQERFIEPQARILNYLKTQGIKGICEAEHFLELKDGRKVILFKEFPKGRTLEEMVNWEGYLDEDKAIDIALKTATILKSLHDAGVYHWDIGPNNIWITDEGEVILFDFDLSFVTEADILNRDLWQYGPKKTMSPERRKIFRGGQYEESPVPYYLDDLCSLARTISDISMVKSNQLKKLLRKAYPEQPYRYKDTKGFIDALKRLKEISSQRKGQSNALKGMGRRSKQDEENIKTAKGYERIWAEQVKACFAEINTIKGEAVKAKFIRDDKNLPDGMFGYHFYDEAGDLIIVTETRFQDESAYHEAREAFWTEQLTEDGTQVTDEISHQIYILAALEQSLRCSEDDELTLFHQHQIRNKTIDELHDLIDEYEQGNRQFHKDVITAQLQILQEKWGEDVLTRYEQYEALVIEKAKERLKILEGIEQIDPTEMKIDPARHYIDQIIALRNLGDGKYRPEALRVVSIDECELRQRKIFRKEIRRWARAYRDERGSWLLNVANNVRHKTNTNNFYFVISDSGTLEGFFKFHNNIIQNVAISPKNRNKERFIGIRHEMQAFQIHNSRNALYTESKLHMPSDSLLNSFGLEEEVYMLQDTVTMPPLVVDRFLKEQARRIEQMLRLSGFIIPDGEDLETVKEILKGTVEHPVDTKLQVLEAYIEQYPNLISAVVALSELWTQLAWFNKAFNLVDKTLKNIKGVDTLDEEELRDEIEGYEWSKLAVIYLKLKKIVEDLNETRKRGSGKFIAPKGDGSGYYIDKAGISGTLCLDISGRPDIENGEIVECAEKRDFGQDVVLPDGVSVVLLDDVEAAVPSGKLPDVELVSAARSNSYACKLLEDSLHENGIGIDRLCVNDTSSSYGHGITNRYVRIFRAESTNIVGISAYELDLNAINQIIRAIKEEVPEAFIVIGGPCTNFPKRLLSLLGDFKDIIIVRGQGGDVFPQLCKIIGDKKATEDFTDEELKLIVETTKGIYLRHRNKIVMSELDVYNISSEFHIPRIREHEVEEIRSRKLEEEYDLITSEGCPNRCEFCTEYLFKPPKFRYVDNKELKLWFLERLKMQFPESIDLDRLEDMLRTGDQIDELQDLMKDRIKINFWDDNFLLNRGRVVEMATMFKELGLKRYFSFFVGQTHINTIAGPGEVFSQENIDFVDLLAEAGFYYMNFGTDEINSVPLIHKGYNITHLMEVNRLVRSKGIYTENNVIFSTPDTTLDRMVETLMLFYALPIVFSSNRYTGVFADLGSSFNNRVIAATPFLMDFRRDDYDLNEYGYADLDSVVVNPRYLAKTIFSQGYRLPLLVQKGDKITKLMIDDLRNLFNVDVIEAQRIPGSKIFELVKKHGDQVRLSVDRVVKNWLQLEETDPELYALARLLEKERDYLSGLGSIETKMMLLDITSFVIYLERMGDQDVRKIDEILFKAEQYLSSNEYAKAIEYLEQKSQKNSNDVFILFMLCKAYLMIGNIEEAHRLKDQIQEMVGRVFMVEVLEQQIEAVELDGSEAPLSDAVLTSI